uniref:Uncharacterized protein n=1 Tax=viral metagenome TaxID=1070528 RepID=A0A6M3M415_9ZZZZ
MAEKAKIEAVIRRTTLAPDGTFAEVYEVSFITPKGVRDRVEIPVEKYTAEFARQKVDEAAAEHEKLLGA